MKDKWMNINHENDELKPYDEPVQDFSDNYRIGTSARRNDACTGWCLFLLETMLREGTYTREQIIDSLTARKYDDITAFYLLLGLRTNEVSSVVAPVASHHCQSRPRLTRRRTPWDSHRRRKVSLTRRTLPRR